MDDLVSVIIPVHNAGEYIYASIASVLAQFGVEIEVVVVDDGSNDDSVSIAQSISDSRLTVICNKENSGYPVAMNVGLKHAKGEFIARMDADDISLPGRIARQVDILKEDPSYVFVGSIADRITPRNFVLPTKTSGDPLIINENWDTVFNNNRKFVDPSVIVRKTDILRVGGYRTYKRTGQDVDLWLRLLELRNCAATINESLYIRRLRTSMITLDVNTYRNNTLPRLFAEQRAKMGSDPVMRGEEYDDLIADDDIVKSRERSVALIWGVANMCFEAGDYYSCYRFMRKAWLEGRLNAASVCKFSRFLQKCLKSMAYRKNKRRILYNGIDV